MKRGAEYTRIIDKKTGVTYELHTIARSNNLYEVSAGTHVVLNPKYNGEPQYLFFKESDVEPVREERTNAWYEQQKRLQEQAGVRSREWKE